MAVKVQDSHDYHFVDVKPSFALPNALQRKFPSLGRKPTEPLDKPLFDGTNFLLGIVFPELLVKGKKMSYRRARRGMLISADMILGIGDQLERKFLSAQHSHLAISHKISWLLTDPRDGAR
jgi:hypothetical protein